jgi:ATP-binding cassette subfamily F protein uup
VLISHDRRFLEKLSRRTLWLDRGTLRENNASFAEFEDWRDKVYEEEEREHHKLGRKIVREEHWVTHGVSGRRKRNMRRLGELAELRKSFGEHQKPEGTAKLAAADARESGKLVIEANGRFQGARRQGALVGTFRCGSIAATASALSARTAPARQRWSNC